MNGQFAENVIYTDLQDPITAKFVEGVLKKWITIVHGSIIVLAKKTKNTLLGFYFIQLCYVSTH